MLFIGKLAVSALLVLAVVDSVWGAPPSTTRASDDEVILLKFPENVDLKIFIEYVSDRMGINIVYDDQAVNQKVTLKSPTPVPKSSLMGLLQSVLQTKGLVLVDAEQPGWKRIIAASGLAAAARPSTQPIQNAATSQPAAVTQIFTLAHADATKAEQVIKPFLTQPGGGSIALPDLHLLIVTDYSTNVVRIAQLVSLVDQPLRQVVTRFVPAKNIDATLLSQEVTTLLAARGRSEGTAAAPSLEVTAEPRTNQLVFIGTEDAVTTATELLPSLDVPLNLSTRTYQFQNIAPDRIDKLVKELIGATENKRSYTSTVDTDSRLLIVTATDSVQQQIASLKAQLDVPGASQDQSPIRFYKLDNTTATDVLQTIQAISGDEGMTSVTVQGQANASPTTTPPLTNLASSASQVQAAPPPISSPALSGGMTTASLTPGAESANPATPAPPGTGRQGVKTKDATITADPNTNSIIVVAKPEVQRVYEELIRTLDKRRPQVLIECTIVTLDTSNNFSLGVEISGTGGGGNTNVVSFSSFGLSNVGTTTGKGGDLGQLTLTPGLGFNGTLIQSNIAQIVIRALVSSGHAEVVSAPKILVNDNTAGQLSSVQEAPFTSVNASSTVATTAFAGYASAGTSIAVTPHISEGEFLQLEYTVSLNSFTGDAASGGTPPPRQTNQLQSKVTIPDGSTIIVGGLNRKNYSHTVDAIPVLGDIPFLKYFFSSRTNTESTSTLFVFIRPVVLRDDKFADLKFYSQRDIRTAGIPSGFPKSEPFIIH